ncbi:winged helix-turn-helix transcriptional regulator [Limosilactobacillus fastidiosus]|uniref:Helix-turn-helix transcriptional regulator n=1 Tax=Limosilactobacillus fastidiosus TaxID=2759855 RepID=A0A7W3TZQ2_9LACO|nr:helix-turn-helix domain-containing protein [Limosilactobacillus fastidiosus]MBB1062965.1 helix-turn-helix transcriptional regulator [Limosilactobacillus fastidiosus]MBB1086209.1 helix-turn-helix transcriptional regulator [Limosilactobacillus fastidiosus]MCD7084558.1 helix-turn-helix transcriptional regulator [Limosilactobacillus fastidiosus]MCD7086519.1 helix-turn-helix transcriptional regulator [Limosilactobacillus fastidiosus]MCD7114960.1 helix-turn-helix transcriptional regulator [Limosi
MDKTVLANFKRIDMEPFNEAMDLISGKWKMNILFCISEIGTMRYGEIRSTLGNITNRVLSKKLKELEENDLIIRKEYPQIPPKVEYSLAPKGKSLLPILRMICDWGKDNEMFPRKDVK